MGVMACDRHGCEEIMCNLCVNNKYLCSYCADEFKELIGEELMSKKDLSIKFDNFMRSKKMYTGSNDIMTVNEFIKNGFLEDRRSWEHG